MKKELFGSKKRIAGTVASVLIGLIFLAALISPDEKAGSSVAAAPPPAPATVTVTTTDESADEETLGESLSEMVENDTAGKAAAESEYPGETVAQENARQSAESYLSGSHFSRQGLIDQLEYEGYTTADATYGVDAQGADWNEQAAGSAADYLDSSSFSRSSLIDQLLYEDFTPAQAEYGVSQTGL